MKVVFNGLLGGWFVVKGAHHTPISGRFASRNDAVAYLKNRNR
jgi:hypothetical protein